METESKEEFEAKIKKKKEIKNTQPIVMVENVPAQTKKRKIPHPPTEIKSNKDDPMVREDLKKVKKETARKYLIVFENNF